MSVLPDAATLASFFVLLIILMLGTILAALDRVIISAAMVRVQHLVRVQCHSIDQLYRLVPHLTVTGVFRFLVFELPTNELQYGLHLLQPVRRNMLYNRKFSRSKFMADIMRLLLFPLWIALTAVSYTISALLSLSWWISKCCTRCCR